MLFLSSFPVENVNILTLLKSRPFHPKDSIRHFATIIRVSDLKAFEDITAGQTKKGTLRKWPKVRERLRENGLEDFHPDKCEDLKKKRKSESRDGGRGFWSRRHWQPKPAGRFSFMLRLTLTMNQSPKIPSIPPHKKGCQRTFTKKSVFGGGGFPQETLKCIFPRFILDEEHLIHSGWSPNIFNTFFPQSPTSTPTTTLPPSMTGCSKHSTSPCRFLV